MDIKDYRQPMVTSIGVILGFLIGFLGQWVTENDFNLTETADYVVFIGCLFGVLTLFITLFRMLNPQLPENVTHYYLVTFYLYMAGVVISFASLFLSALF